MYIILCATKKAWRKSLRHATIKENLIVKIEISDSNSYSGTNLFLLPLHPGIKLGYLVNGC